MVLGEKLLRQVIFPSHWLLTTNRTDGALMLRNLGSGCHDALNHRTRPCGMFCEEVLISSVLNAVIPGFIHSLPLCFIGSHSIQDSLDR